MTTATRDRIYGGYVHTRPDSWSPKDIAQVERAGPYLRHLIRHHFPKNKSLTVLDLGCGYGALLDHARRMGFPFVRGVDRSPEMVAEARRLRIHDVREGDLFDALAGTPSETIGAVVTLDVIEHLTRDETLRLADETRRVLKPEGRWIIQTPNGESPMMGRVRYGDLTHEQAFTRTSLGQLLMVAGFRSIAFHEVAPVVHGVASALRFVAWKGIRGLLRFYLAAETGDTGRSAIFTQNLLAIGVR